MTAKRRFFGVMAFLSITALVFMAGIVVVAVAQDNEEKLTFTERVAAILGIETQKVEDAIEQAKAEIASERRESFTDDLLEKGVFTEEEVEELFEEWTDKVEFLPSHSVGQTNGTTSITRSAKFHLAGIGSAQILKT